MNFLAVDTSGAYLSAVAKRGDKTALVREADARLGHSARLMDAVERALEEAGLRPEDADFFAAVVGPGSFTGIRIGVSTVKALALAFGRPVKAVTSLSLAAYHVGGAGKTLALVDARHGSYYACRYIGLEPVGAPAFVSGDRAARWIASGYAPVGVGEVTGIDAPRADETAALALAAAAAAAPLLTEDRLEPLYLRKSQAEEGR